MTRRLAKLDQEALAMFACKGREGGPGVPQAGQANAVKVRRVLQLTTDLTRRPLEELRILDLGCGEGVYAIEAALHGAEVVAVDARAERMRNGTACAARHGLVGVRFEQTDVRSVTKVSHGTFDVVWALGILYHLDVPDVFSVLASIRGLCRTLLVVDSLIAPKPACAVSHHDHVYSGDRFREHGDDDPPSLRRSRLLKSIDNTFSFRFNRDSLVRAVEDAGFSAVLECHVPVEPGKAEDRITLAALAGERVSVATYPWVNGLSEGEVEQKLKAFEGEAG
jgi:SAM-dependent methyltransferase